MLEVAHAAFSIDGAACAINKAITCLSHYLILTCQQENMLNQLSSGSWSLVGGGICVLMQLLTIQSVDCSLEQLQQNCSLHSLLLQMPKYQIVLALSTGTLMPGGSLEQIAAPTFGIEFINFYFTFDFGNYDRT